MFKIFSRPQFLTYLLCAVSILFIFCSSQAAAQSPSPSPSPKPNKLNWRAPYTDANTLGGVLEPEYFRILEDCKIGKLKFDKKEISSVPNSVQRALGAELDTTIWKQKTDSLARLFSYIFTTKSVSSMQPERKWLLFGDDFDLDVASVIPKNTARFIYSHNCSGIVNAAAEAGSAYKFPSIAEYQAALKVEYSDSKKLMIALVAGRFESPFEALFDGKNKPNRFTALMTLWDWYRRNSGELTDTASFHIISSFRGAAVVGINQQMRSASGTLSSSGSVSVPFFSASAKVGGTATEENKLDILSFITAGYYRSTGNNGTEEDINWKTLDTPEQIKISVGAEYNTRRVDPYIKVLELNVPAVSKQTIPGMPRELCTRENYWTAVINPSTTGSTPQGNIAVTDVEPLTLAADNPKVTDCRFTVQFTPSTIGANGDWVELKYSFQTVQPVRGISLEIPAEPVSYSTSRSPELTSRFYDEKFLTQDRSDNSKRLVWVVDLNVFDDPPILDWTRKPFAPRGMQIKCGNDKPITVSAEASLVPADKTMQLTVFLNTKPEQNFEFDKPKEAQTCTLTGNLRFYRSAGSAIQTVDKDIPELTLKFPRVKPVETPR
jgi:hypothetical protein